jgi:hypothetical protein
MNIHVSSSHRHGCFSHTGPKDVAYLVSGVGVRGKVVEINISCSTNTEWAPLLAIYPNTSRL